MYWCSPVLGFWTITTCEKGSYSGYFSMTLSPLGIGFGGGGGIGSCCSFFLKRMFILIFFRFFKPERDSLRRSFGITGSPLV